MTSQWPGSLDYNPDPDTPYSAWDRAAIKQLQAKLQRMLNAQPNAFPASGATVTPDMSQGWRLLIFLPSGVNTITVANPINPQQGDFLILYTLQNSTGTALLSFGTKFRKTASLSIPAAVANSLDVITFDYSSGADKWNQFISPVLSIA